MSDRRYTTRLTDEQIVELFTNHIFHVDIDLAIVTNLVTGNQMTPYIGNTEGHRFVRIYYNQSRRTTALHRLVWMFATLTPIPTGWEIHHRDSDTSHNAFSNLLCLHQLDHRKLHAETELPF